MSSRLQHRSRALAQQGSRVSTAELTKSVDPTLLASTARNLLNLLAHNAGTTMSESQSDSVSRRDSEKLKLRVWQKVLPLVCSTSTSTTNNGSESKGLPAVPPVLPLLSGSEVAFILSRLAADKSILPSILVCDKGKDPVFSLTALLQRAYSELPASSPRTVSVLAGAIGELTHQIKSESTAPFLNFLPHYVSTNAPRLPTKDLATMVRSWGRLKSNNNRPSDAVTVSDSDSRQIDPIETQMLRRLCASVEERQTQISVAMVSSAGQAQRANTPVLDHSTYYVQITEDLFKVWEGAISSDETLLRAVYGLCRRFLKVGTSTTGSGEFNRNTSNRYSSESHVLRLYLPCWSLRIRFLSLLHRVESACRAERIAFKRALKQERKRIEKLQMRKNRSKANGSAVNGAEPNDNSEVFESESNQDDTATAVMRYAAMMRRAPAYVKNPLRIGAELKQELGYLLMAGAEGMSSGAEGADSDNFDSLEEGYDSSSKLMIESESGSGSGSESQSKAISISASSTSSSGTLSSPSDKATALVQQNLAHSAQLESRRELVKSKITDALLDFCPQDRLAESSQQLSHSSINFSNM